VHCPARRVESKGKGEQSSKKRGAIEREGGKTDFGGWGVPRLGKGEISNEAKKKKKKTDFPID